MKRDELTVEEANAIQAAWRDLKLDAPEAEKRRVMLQVERLPRSYLSLFGNGTALVMLRGQPGNAVTLPVASAVEVAAGWKVQTRLRWSTATGQWTEGDK